MVSTEDREEGPYGEVFRRWDCQALRVDRGGGIVGPEVLLRR